MKGASIKAFLFCVLLMAAVAVSAQSWTVTTAPVKNWNSVVSSADGTKLAATSLNGGFDTSTNSGATWQTNLLTFILHAAISADGSVLAAVAGGTVYGSTNGGQSWRTNGFIGQDDNGIACSADGTKLAMINPQGNGGHIFTSTDRGLSWTTNALAGKNWSGVRMSADGTKLVVVANTGGNLNSQVFTSTNFGVSWTSNIINAPVQSWTCVASSADGTQLAAGIGGNGGSVYTSPDEGNTWNSNTIPNYTWSSLACSADGSRLIACSSGFQVIFTSTNFGLSWVSNTVAKLNWAGVASSADGNKRFAVVANGGIYTWQATPAPQLNVALANGNLAFSWTVPSTNFVLQQASDLILLNWTTLTNLPALNFSNLQEQVSLLPTNNNGFFRLVAQ